MPSEEPPKLSDAEITAALVEVLQSWPLYRTFKYRADTGPALVPDVITLHCDNCGKEQSWQTSFYGGEDGRRGFTTKEYKYRNCGGRVTRYFLYWWQQPDKSF